MEKSILKDVDIKSLKQALSPALLCGPTISVRVGKGKLEYVSAKDSSFYKRYEVALKSVCGECIDVPEDDVVHVFIYNGKALLDALGALKEKCDINFLHNEKDGALECDRLVLYNENIKLYFDCAELQMGYLMFDDGLREQVFGSSGEAMKFNISAHNIKSIKKVSGFDNISEDTQMFTIYKGDGNLMARGAGFTIVLQKGFVGELTECTMPKSYMALLDEEDYTVDVTKILSKDGEEVEKATMRSIGDNTLECTFGLIQVDSSSDRVAQNSYDGVQE